MMVDNAAPQESLIPTGQGRIYAKWWPGVAADSPPIVLLHDSLGCVDLWRDFPANLARATGRTVIAYDRLGFGKSDPHPGRLQVGFIDDEALGAFAALLAHFQLSRFIVFGHSVGGGMSVAIAAAYPQQCLGVITESAQEFVEDRTLQGIRVAGEQFKDSAQLDRLKRYHGDKAQWVLDAWVKTWLSVEFAHWNLDAVLPAVTVPFLAIHGENDEYGSMRHPEKFVTLAGGAASMLPLPGCGHVPHREREDVVLDAVRGFLDQ
ncbi:MAG: alpha/beta fold hydrolase [Achromobacter pestifer]